MNQAAVPRMRAATEQDADDIRGLLAQSELPTADIETSKPEFIVADEGATLIAVGGLQRFGTTGLLRSLAVHASRRGTGLGRAMVQHLEQHARDEGLAELVLLTQTAQRFFEAQGYRVIDRGSAPDTVQGSEEFKSLCPQSACCMSKRLNEPSA